VYLSDNVSILGFNPEDTIIVKKEANIQFKVEGKEDKPIKGINLSGWTFDGRGNVNELGGTLSSVSNGGAFELLYCERSNFDAKIINHKTSSKGGAIYSDNSKYIKAEHIFP
jgi:hypothetical protein